MTHAAQLDKSDGPPRIMGIVPRAEVTVKAVNDGDWSSSSTWDSGVPGADDRVYIPDGVAVTLASQQTAAIKTVRVDGTLTFDPSVATKLRAETIVTDKDSTLEIGTTSSPIQGGVTAEIEFVDNGVLSRSEDEEDSFFVRRGLITHGEITIAGQEKTPYETLATHATTGDTSIDLSAEPTNWEVGDTIVLPGQEAYTDNTPSPNNDEERTISSISGTTVSFDTSLNNDHVPATGFDSYAVNLSRNVKLYSESSERLRRGHFMCMNEPALTMQYFETEDMGRVDKKKPPTSPHWGRNLSDSAEPDGDDNPRARYSVHFHKVGSGATNPHTVTGAVVKNVPGWGYVNHGSYAKFIKCISYDCDGAGFAAENGTERGKVKECFALRSTGSGEDTESRKGWSNAFANKWNDKVDDFGHSGHGIWCHSPLVEVVGNICAGHRHTPITIWTRALYEDYLDSNQDLDGKHDMFPLLKYEWLNESEKGYAKTGDQDPTVGTREHSRGSDWVYGTSIPMRKFQDNVAFGCGGGFDLRGGLSFRNKQSELDHRYHKNNRIYNVGELWLSDGTGQGQSDFQSSGKVGLDHRYVGNLRADNYEIVGQNDAGSKGVYNNSTYIDDFHVENSTIKNWDHGIEPSHYTGRSQTDVLNNTFSGNTVDVYIPGRFGDDGWLKMKGNSWGASSTHIYWEEINEPNMIPRRFTNPESTKVTYEDSNGNLRTVYHGWSDPNFVIVQSGDSERLNKMMNHGNHDRWQSLLNGDDPETVLPGATHQELYNQYGITFYGGLQDPSQSGFEQPTEFDGSGGTYDSTPFLGPASKTQPCDEIWIDVVNHCTFSGDYEILTYGQGTYSDGSTIPNEEPIQKATDQKVVELRRDGEHGSNADLPVTDAEGVASYTFSVDTTGDYHVLFRCQQGDTTGSANDADSRFYTRIDGGSWQLVDGKNNGIAPMDDLVWGPKRYPTKPNQWATHNIGSTGQHTIDIAGKGWRMRLDKVLIKHVHVGANPAGEGKPHTT